MVPDISSRQAVFCDGQPAPAGRNLEIKPASMLLVMVVAIQEFLLSTHRPRNLAIRR